MRNTVKATCTLLLLLSQILICSAQLPDGFKTVPVNKKVKDFTPDSINLSSPLDYYLSRAWVRSTGKVRYWADISTSKFQFDPAAPDEQVSEDLRNYILDENIESIVSYRDTAAAILTHSEGDDFILLNFCWIEEGKWVNGGQWMAMDSAEAESILRTQLPVNYENLPRIARIKSMPEDPRPFTAFLSGIEASPEEFLLEMLGTHKLVINGEYHRRKVSWDMLKRLIRLPGFHEKTGRIFMELPSWCQPKMDAFMDSDTLNTGTILEIFREEQPNGWWDRGEFEFICDVWRLNRSLPAGKRIRIVLADYQIPYSKITDRKDARSLENRNTHMADVIEETVRTSSDGRNSLFLVGCAHAYKSRQSGIASAASGQAEVPTAGAQLTDRLGAENVFTVFQHVLPGDNTGNNKTPIRGGMFDRAFEADGNRPVGFRLAGSPFGDEPFDGIYEIKYNASTGTYADNFDGYLFLHPIADEPQAEPLTEIFTDRFVEEIKRRASVLGTGHIPALWFGRKAQDLTREYIIGVLQEE